ncbi:MBL fold metallo-hydrolase [Candidatus Auribacterota bacterium]
MIIKQIAVGPMGNFSYLIADEDNKEGLVIDPAWEINKILNEAKKEDIHIIYIVNTHYHIDHTNGNQEILKRTRAKLIAHEKEIDYISPPPDIKVKDLDTIKLGKLEIKIIHTPGHSEGGICLLVENNLFTGDTLFVEGAGRTDLPGGDSKTLYSSLEKLKKLDDDLTVYPGHFYGPKKHATLKFIKEVNPYL